MPPLVLLLRVAAAWPVPGLGLLALPAGPAAAPLRAHALHTALAVEARPPGGAALPGTATVEEVERGGRSSYGLLLDLGGPVDLPPGTEIWGRAVQPPG
ncbi:hypothetical protein ACFQ48_06790 [Hymenobacter caeli]|uniref:Uncharacterized protein n=1 Tax=Hymenobacter caeli TaxID=2735894 RepID=A0ABX2FR78_9BACT|nr:hypothetical protein [Hymenobacter caeli]NRT18889.1 hypothetical protein [Hymenobacter caeli]